MITYDRTAFHGLVVSPTAWTATGPLGWFDHFVIVALKSDPVLGEAMHTIGLDQYLSADEPMPKTVNDIYQSPALAKLLHDQQLEDYTHIFNRTRKATDQDGPVLTNHYSIVGQYESKVAFRNTFASSVRMPKYEIVSLSAIVEHGTYQRLSDALSPRLVIQHPDMSGSRGTFFVSNSAEFDAIAHKLLDGSMKPTKEVVISEQIESPRERSLQVCILQDDVLVGPAQAQLLRHPLLTYDANDAIQFCGGQVSSDLMTIQEYDEASAYARIVGAELQAAGYRGIFGIDFLLTDHVYVIEANLRFTGLSPLLANIQRQAPFMLLHVLELSRQAYQLEVDHQDEGSGSFITVYAQQDGSSDVTTGLYDEDLNWLGEGFAHQRMLPEQSGQFFVAMRTVPGQPVKAGKSLAFIYSQQSLFDADGHLTPAATTIVTAFRSRFIPAA